MLMSDYQALINWYPGHMAKARRLLIEQVRRVDLVIELCDARLPYSSRNPDLSGIVSGRSKLLFLNKSDLSDSAVTERWLQSFRTAGIEAYQSNSLTLNSKETIGIIDRSTREIVRKASEKGVRKTVRAMIIGIPNVGKSTFINRLCGRRIAQIGDRPGVTRSNQWVKVSPYLELLDTPGLLWPRMEDQTAARRLCYLGSVRDEILDLYDLTIHLLEDLCLLIPDRVMERFHFEDPSLKGIDLLDAVCSGRGWIMKGNQFDYDRCCSVVLDEFRGGRLGRISLEQPEETHEEMNGNDRPSEKGH